MDSTLVKADTPAMTNAEWMRIMSPMGSSKGGKNRAARLSPLERSAIAALAGAASQGRVMTPGERTAWRDGYVVGAHFAAGWKRPKKKSIASESPEKPLL